MRMTNPITVSAVTVQPHPLMNWLSIKWQMIQIAIWTASLKLAHYNSQTGSRTLKPADRLLLPPMRRQRKSAGGGAWLWLDRIYYHLPAERPDEAFCLPSAPIVLKCQTKQWDVSLHSLIFRVKWNAPFIEFCVGGGWGGQLWGRKLGVTRLMILAKLRILMKCDTQPGCNYRNRSRCLH